MKKNMATSYPRIISYKLSRARRVSFKNCSDKSHKKLSHLLSLGHTATPELINMVIVNDISNFSVCIKDPIKDGGYNNRPSLTTWTKLGKNVVIG